MANLPKSFTSKSKRSGTFKKFHKPKKYNSEEWIKYRAKFLAVNPLCYCCGKPSNVVDHWRAWKNNEELFYQEDNMIPMCDSCHSIVTQLFDKHEIPKTEEKLKWISKKRLETDTTVRSKVVSWER